MYRKILLLLLVTAFAIVAPGCSGLPPEVRKATLAAMEINKAHMQDESLPEEARLIAQDNYDFQAQLLHSVDSDALPKDTADRMAARQKENQVQNE